jgi:phage terminase large subunit-like protein
VHLVVANSLTKRVQGRELNVSTPGADVDSLAGRLHSHGVRVASGELADDAFLHVWHTAPLELDLADEDQRRQAIVVANPQAADRPDLIDNLMHRFEEIPEHEFRRYHLAQWVEGGGNRYMPMDAWRRQGRAGHPVEGTSIVMAFDGSYRHDSTGIVGETLDGHQFVIGVWESEGQPDGWTVPRDEVDAAVANAMARYKVRRFACDPPGWHREIADWSQRYGEDVVVEFPTATRSRMVSACGAYYEAVMAGEVTHADDPVLTRHLGNAVLKETPEGAHITKDGPNSPRKIDLAVCAVVAHDQVVRVRAEPPKRQYRVAAF